MLGIAEELNALLGHVVGGLGGVGLLQKRFHLGVDVRFHELFEHLSSALDPAWGEDRVGCIGLKETILLPIGVGVLFKPLRLLITFIDRLEGLQVGDDEGGLRRACGLMGGGGRLGGGGMLSGVSMLGCVGVGGLITLCELGITFLHAEQERVALSSNLIISTTTLILQINHYSR